MVPKRHVVAEVLQEETQVATVPVPWKKNPLTLLLPLHRKPPKRQGQRRRDLAEFHVQRTAHHLLVGHHDGLGQVKMKVRVVGVTRGELPVPDVHRFVGLTLGPVGVEDNVLLGGDRMATQALARFEVVAKLILGEGLRTVLELRPPHPSARAVPLPVRTHFPCLKVQHDAVGAQRHRAADHLGLPGQVRQPAVHREVDVLGVVFHHLPRGDDVVGLGGIGCGRLGPKHRAY